MLLLGPASGAEAAEFLHLAAVASLTEVAVEEAREEVEENLRGSFLEDLRARPDLEGDEVVRRAARLGLRPVRGRRRAVRGAHERPPAPRRGDDRRGAPGALAAAPRRARVRAAAGRRRPAGGGRSARARGLAERLRRHGLVGLSSFYSDPAELGRSIQEAELVLDVVRRSGAPIEQDIGDRHVPPAVPRARLAPRGGAVVLRGHGRAGRALRRPVPRPTSSGRSRPTSSTTAT